MELLSEAELKQILETTVKEVKAQMKNVIKSAVDTFYGSASPGTYSRTMGLQNILVNDEPDEAWDYDKVFLTYHFSSDNVSVNPWLSPWGIEYGGNPEYAFMKAYDEGYHGGPKPIRPGGWTWEYTQKSDPIYNLIMAGVSSIV